MKGRNYCIEISKRFPASETPSLGGTGFNNTILTTPERSIVLIGSGGKATCLGSLVLEELE